MRLLFCLQLQLLYIIPLLFTFVSNHSLNTIIEKTFSNESANGESLIWKGGSVIDICTIIDLKGESLIIPSDCTLRFRGGKIKNGVVIGSNTKIERSRRSAIFQNVTIKGCWNITEVSSSFFEETDNVLQQVFALTDSLMYNKVIIEKGYYYVSRLDENEGIINIKSNTDVEIKGIVSVSPNNYSHYYILNLKDAKNVHISGGLIIGDRLNHRGNSGEWGHGIFIWGDSENIKIDGVKISNCWGDGVAIGRSESVKDVRLNNLRIDNCRRNGISVIACEGCKIKKCIIRNINGTAPEYAIDIEPNKSSHVCDVELEQIKIRSRNGILLPIANSSDYHYIKRIRITNCDINTEQRCISVDGAEDIIIKGNKLVNKTEDRSIPLVIDHESKSVVISNNTIIKDIRNIDPDASVLFVNPGHVTVTENIFKGKNCSLGYFANGDHLLTDNIIETRVGFTRIRNSLIMNNVFKGESFLPSTDNGCALSNNRVRKARLRTKER